MAAEVATPQNGGCWYCNLKDDKLSFTCEFDAYVHPECVRQALEADPEDREAQIIARELEIEVGRGTEA